MSTTIITYPSNQGFPGFTKYTFSLNRKSMSLRSPFSGKRQTINHPYALWAFKGDYSMCDTTNASLLRAFLTELQGQANAFNLVLPDYAKPSTGYSGAAGVVNGAGQTGTSLVTNGWSSWEELEYIIDPVTGNYIIDPISREDIVETAISRQIFNPGDYFTVINSIGNPELKIVTSAVSSDSSGNATINFLPAIRNSPSNDTALVINNPYVCLCSNSDASASWDLTPPILYSASIDCLECVE